MSNAAYSETHWPRLCMLLIKIISIVFLLGSIIYLGISGANFAVLSAIFFEEEWQGTLLVVVYALGLFVLMFAASLLGIWVSNNRSSKHALWFCIASVLIAAALIAGISTSFFSAGDSAFGDGLVSGINFFFCVLSVVAAGLSISFIVAEGGFAGASRSVEAGADAELDGAETEAGAEGTVFSDALSADADAAEPASPDARPSDADAADEAEDATGALDVPVPEMEPDMGETVGFEPEPPVEQGTEVFLAAALAAGLRPDGAAQEDAEADRAKADARDEAPSAALDAERGEAFDGAFAEAGRIDSDGRASEAESAEPAAPRFAPGSVPVPKVKRTARHMAHGAGAATSGPEASSQVASAAAERDAASPASATEPAPRASRVPALDDSTGSLDPSEIEWVDFGAQSRIDDDDDESRGGFIGRHLMHR